MFERSFTDDLKRAFGQLTGAFRDKGTVCFLLRRGVMSARYEVLLELEGDYHVSYVEGSFREDIMFKSFSTDDSFPGTFAAATAIAWGVPDADGDVDVYSIDPDQRDRAAASGTSPLDRCSARRISTERFRVPNN